MEKRILSLILSIVLIVCALALTLSSCGNGEGAQDTSENTSENTSAETTAVGSSSESTDTETTSTEPIETDAIYTVSGESGELELEWSLGTVCSSSNSLYKNQISTILQNHSYTNVITFPKAGTKISFVDEKPTFASKGSYIFSSWTMVNGKWTLDTEGINYAGSSSAESWIATPVGDSMVYTYVTSYAGESLRICYHSGHTDKNTPVFPTVTFEVTGEKGTYEQQLEYEASTTLPIPESEYWFSVFEDVEQMNIIGDSYFGSNNPGKEYVWPQLLANKYGFSLDNKGIGGSTMSNFVTTNHPMVDRYTDMPDNDPQIVLLQGGRNDRNKNVPIGNNTDVDTKTYKGAVNYLITKLQEKYPNALLICITPWKINTDSDRNDLGKNTYDYAKAMVEVCEYRGVVCFNAADTELSQVYMEDAEFRSKYCIAGGDISHLNIKGFEYVMPKFEKFIAAEYEEFLNAKQSN
ncbi:MAG: SGNH/GDSL hydrolase family protein [Clostridia bacterium]|nr:SGNH/GDSL hydrolase family protein [Clostridia bacterium]